MIFAIFLVIQVVVFVVGLVVAAIGLGLTIGFRRIGPHASALALTVGGEALAFISVAYFAFAIFTFSMTVGIGLGVAFAVSFLALAIVCLILGLRQAQKGRRVLVTFNYLLLALGVILLAAALGNFGWSMYTLYTYCPTNAGACG